MPPPAPAPPLGAGRERGRRELIPASRHPSRSREERDKSRSGELSFPSLLALGAGRAGSPGTRRGQGCEHLEFSSGSCCSAPPWPGWVWGHPCWSPQLRPTPQLKAVLGFGARVVPEDHPGDTAPCWDGDSAGGQPEGAGNGPSWGWEQRAGAEGEAGLSPSAGQDAVPACPGLGRAGLFLDSEPPVTAWKRGWHRPEAVGDGGTLPARAPRRCHRSRGAAAPAEAAGTARCHPGVPKAIAASQTPPPARWLSPKAVTAAPGPDRGFCPRCALAARPGPRPLRGHGGRGRAGCHPPGTGPRGDRGAAGAGKGPPRLPGVAREVPAPPGTPAAPPVSPGPPGVPKKGTPILQEGCPPPPILQEGHPHSGDTARTLMGGGFQGVPQPQGGVTVVQGGDGLEGGGAPGRDVTAGGGGGGALGASPGPRQPEPSGGGGGSARLGSARLCRGGCGHCPARPGRTMTMSSVAETLLGSDPSKAAFLELGPPQHYPLHGHPQHDPPPFSSYGRPGHFPYPGGAPPPPHGGPYLPYPPPGAPHAPAPGARLQDTGKGGAGGAHPPRARSRPGEPGLRRESRDGAVGSAPGQRRGWAGLGPVRGPGGQPGGLGVRPDPQGTRGWLRGAAGMGSISPYEPVSPGTPMPPPFPPFPPSRPLSPSAAHTLQLLSPHRSPRSLLHPCSPLFAPKAEAGSGDPSLERAEPAWREPNRPRGCPRGPGRAPWVTDTRRLLLGQGPPAHPGGGRGVHPGAPPSPGTPPAPPAGHRPRPGSHRLNGPIPPFLLLSFCFPRGLNTSEEQPPHHSLPQPPPGSRGDDLG
uniref:Uncharacterized protein n=1 Tax=Chloebia gouldiae TaxID=44316 RepID=A0A3L8QVS8_CHLGU|nr:hypothetical protein DV515_00017390 [Chloebia gouldiae]